MGIVADGYISGARVYKVDASGNEIKRADGSAWETFTDAKGQFNINLLPTAGKMVAEGGIDTSTGLAFTVKLYAPAGAIVVNPLTTLIQSYIERTGKTESEASAAISKVLGLPASFNLLTSDPITVANSAAGADQAAALNVQIKAAQIANLLVTGAIVVSQAQFTTADEGAVSVLQSLADQFSLAESSGQTLSLANPGTLALVLSGVQPDLVSLIASGNNISSSTLPDLYAVQKLVQGNVAQTLSNPDLAAQAVDTLQKLLDAVKSGEKIVGISLLENAPDGQVNDSGVVGDHITKVTQPWFTVSLKDALSVLQKGDLVKVSAVIGGDAATTVLEFPALTEQDLAAGYVSLKFPTDDSGRLFGDGSKVLTVQFNRPDGAHVATGFLAVTIDATAPSVLGLSFNFSGAEGFTNNPTVQVSGLEDGASWKYSVDGGAQWLDGSGSSFTLSESVTAYAAGAIRVKQTDVAGNESGYATNANAITVDLTAPNAPNVRLHEDTAATSTQGASLEQAAAWGVDKVTSDPVVTFTLSAQAAAYVYRIDAGEWKTVAASGTLGSITLIQDGTQTVEVYEVDKAGNAGNASAYSLTLDRSVQAPSLSLDADTGNSSEDGVTMNAAFTVSGVEANGAVVQYQVDDGEWDSSISRLTSLADGNHTIKVRQIDAAGNESNASQDLLVNLDTLDPTINNLNPVSGDGVLSSAEKNQALVISGSTGSITDGLNSNLLNGRVVTVSLNGQSYKGVINGSSWAVTVPSTDVSSLLGGATYDVTVSVTDLADNTGSHTFENSLSVVQTNAGLDGYISGATVFVDASGNGVLNAGEYVATTDAVGGFSVPSNGPLVMLGGLDVSTGLNFESKYEALAGYRVINPITTLVRDFDKLGVPDPAGTVIAKGVFGNTGVTANLATYDPLKAATASKLTGESDAAYQAKLTAALSYQKLAAEISNLMTTGAAVIQLKTVATPLTTDDSLPDDWALQVRQEVSGLLVEKLATQLNAHPSYSLANGLTPALVTAVLADVQNGLEARVQADLGFSIALTNTGGVSVADAISLATEVINYSNDKIAQVALASNAPLSNIDDAVDLLTQVVKVQSATQGAISSDLAKVVTSTSPSTLDNPVLTLTEQSRWEDAINTAINAAHVGVIVPARVSIQSVAPPIVEGVSSQYEGNAGEIHNYTVTLVREGNTSAPVSLNYAINAGDGITGADFASNVIPSGTVYFAPKQTTAQIVISVKGDTLKELNERFGLVVFDPEGQVQLLDASGNQASSLNTNFTILNDDPPVPTFVGAFGTSAVNFVAGVEQSLSGLKLDYFKTDAATLLQVSIKTSLAASVSGAGTAQTVSGFKVYALSGTLNEINARLAKLTFTPGADEQTTVLSLSAKDTTGNVIGQTLEPVLNLHHVPVLSLPTVATSVVAGIESALAGVKVSDADNDTLTVTLKPQNASLSLTNVSGITTSKLQDGTLTLSGKAFDLNAALDTLKVTANTASSLAKPVNVSVFVSDGDVLTADPVSTLTINAAPAPTLLSGPSSLTVSRILDGNPNVSGLTLSDADSTQLTVKLTATGGSLSVLTTTNVKYVETVSASGAKTITLAGAVGDLNNAINSLVFKASASSKSGQVIITADDADAASAAASKTIDLALISTAAPKTPQPITVAPVLEDGGALDGSTPVVSLGLDFGSDVGMVRIISVDGGALSYNGNAISAGFNSNPIETLNGKLTVGFTPLLDRDLPANIKYVVIDPAVPSLTSGLASVIVPITPVNDTPVITSDAFNGQLVEDGAVTQLAGQLVAKDIDTGDSLTWALRANDARNTATVTEVTSVAGTFGNFTLNAQTGVWKYAAATAAGTKQFNSLQALAQGQVAYDQVWAQVKDSAGASSLQLIQIKLTGTNDAAVISTVGAVPNVNEDESIPTLVASGTFTVSDADASQTSFSTSVVGAPTNLGSLTLAANGAYTYSVNNAQVQNLAAGQQLIESFTIKSLDGTTQNVSFTVVGTNDRPVVTFGELQRQCLVCAKFGCHHDRIHCCCQ